MRILLLLFTVFTFFNSPVLGQFENVKSEEFLSFPLRRFLFQYDARYAIFSGKNARIVGVRAGISYKEKHRFGVGVYTLASAEKFSQKYTIQSSNGEVDSVQAWPSFRYASIFYERVWYKNKKWEISTPFNAGTGKASIIYAATPLETEELRKGRVWIAEPNINGEFRLHRWLAVGTGIGYRWVWLTNNELPNEYNSWYYTLKARIFVREMYKDLFPNPEKFRIILNSGVEFRKQTGAIHVALGLEVHEKHSWTIGLKNTFISDTNLGTTRLVSGNFQSKEVDVEPGYSIFTLKYGLYLWQRDFWQLELQSGLGIGNSFFSYLNFQNERIRLDEEEVILGMAQTRLHRQILPWLSGFASIGADVFLKGEKDLMEPFEGLNWGLGLKLRFGKSTLRGKDEAEAKN